MKPWRRLGGGKTFYSTSFYGIKLCQLRLKQQKNRGELSARNDDKYHQTNFLFKLITKIVAATTTIEGPVGQS